MNIKQTISELRKALKEDQGYYDAWVHNISVSYQDEAKNKGSRDSRLKLKQIGDDAADNFLKKLMEEL